MSEMTLRIMYTIRLVVQLLPGCRSNNNKCNYKIQYRKSHTPLFDIEFPYLSKPFFPTLYYKRPTMKEEASCGFYSTNYYILRVCYSHLMDEIEVIDEATAIEVYSGLFVNVFV